MWSNGFESTMTLICGAPSGGYKGLKLGWIAAVRDVKDHHTQDQLNTCPKRGQKLEDRASTPYD